jgi:hypothetical protein
MCDITVPLRLRFLRDCGGQCGQEVIDLGVEAFTARRRTEPKSGLLPQRNPGKGLDDRAGVMCSSRSWLMTRHSLAQLGGDPRRQAVSRTPLAEQR